MKKSLKKSEIERFSRQIILKDIGSAGQEKIKKAKILVVGAGGLGCPVAEFLTRAGVGEIGIIDNDVVDISNIHRQSLYDISDLKLSKVQSAKKKLKRINLQLFLTIMVGIWKEVFWMEIVNYNGKLIGQ